MSSSSETSPFVNVSVSFPTPYDPLTEQELALIDAARTGATCNLGSSPEDKKVIRSAVFRDLCLERYGWCIDPIGIRLVGAVFKEALRLDDIDLNFGLDLRNCIFHNIFSIDGCTLRFLFLNGCRLNDDFTANRVEVKQDIYLNSGFEVTGKVSIDSAKIEGLLDCRGGKFYFEGEGCLNANMIEVGQSILLNQGFEAKGQVSLQAARVRGQFSCSGGKFHYEEGICLNASAIEVDQSILLNHGFEAKGQVYLQRARLGGQLGCSGGKFHYEEGICLNAYTIEVGQNIFMTNGFEAKGQVYLQRAKVGSILDCSGGKFNYEGGICLDADTIDTGQSILLNQGFEAKGQVYLQRAKVGSILDCSGGKFNYEEGTCLDASTIEVNQDVLLNNGFEANGAVQFIGAKVMGLFDCSGGSFSNKNGICFDCESAHIHGSTFFRDFRTKPCIMIGQLCLTGSTIEGDLLIHNQSSSIDVSFTRIHGEFQLSPSSVKDEIDLSHANIGLMNDKYAIGYLIENTGWWMRWWQERRLEWFGWITLNPRMTQYKLTGLTYNALAPHMGYHSQELAQWLILADGAEYHPQPYEQMYRVLRAEGYEDTARHIAIAKRIARRREFMHHLYRALPTVPPGPIGSPAFKLHYDCWKRFNDRKKKIVWPIKVGLAWLKQASEFLLLDVPIRYGYGVRNAGILALLLCTFGAFQFHHAYSDHVMVPVSTDILPAAVQEKEKRVDELLSAELAPFRREGLARNLFGESPNNGPFAIDRETRKKAIAATVHLDQCIPEGYPEFNAMMFALDTFLPIIDLNQSAYWIPDRSKPEGRWYWKLQWTLIIAGWYLSTLLAGAFAGLVKSD
jgi:hypothetical protein